MAVSAQVGYGGGGRGGGGFSGPPSVVSVPLAGPTGGSLGGGQVLGASTFNFTRNLSLGSRGQDVIELQKILIAGKFLDIESPTGYFGFATEAAVKAYQRAHGLAPAVGTVGPLTRAELNRGSAPASPSTASAASFTSQEERATLLHNMLLQLQDLLSRVNGLRTWFSQ